MFWKLLRQPAFWAHYNIFTCLLWIFYILFLDLSGHERVSAIVLSNSTQQMTELYTNTLIVHTWFSLRSGRSSYNCSSWWSWWSNRSPNSGWPWSTDRSWSSCWPRKTYSSCSSLRTWWTWNDASTSVVKSLHIHVYYIRCATLFATKCSM